MNTKSKNLKKLGPILSGFLIWILVFSIGVFVAYTLYKIEIKGHLIETQNTLIIIKDSVQRSVGEINKAIEIYISSITEYEGDSHKKNSFTEHLLNTYEEIKLIRIDLEGETKHIYSVAADIEDFSNEQIFKTALELAKSDSIFVSGLYNFEGDTFSVLICTPFQNKYNGAKGVITAVIDLKILLRNSDITSFSELYYLQISDAHQLYYSNTIDDLNPKDFQEITIAKLGLSIYASKKNYELVKEKLIILCCLSFFLSSIFGYLSYFLFRKPQNLEKRLQEKSKELLNSRELFRINSELLSSVLESPQNIVIFSLDRFYNYIAFNENYRRLVGDFYGIPIRKGMNVFDIVPKKNRALLMVNYNRALNGESFDFIQEIVGQDLKNHYWQNWFSPIKDNHNNIIGLTVFSINITKRIKAETELKRNEGRLRTLISSSPYCIHELDVKGRIVSINKAGVEMFKLDSPDQLIGRYYPVLIGKNHSTMIDHLLNKTLTGESTIFEFSTGENHYQSQMIPLKNEDNIVVRIMGITQDITERKKSEAFIENSLKEKTTLLAEIHHRVKNNLAIVSGLLELQKVEVDDNRLSAIFDQSINRIISIAMVHELMYNTEDLSSVNVDTYLHKLVPAISATMQYRNQHVEFKLDVIHYKLNINQAIPLGLLLNELITNSFKYAFNDNTNNIISIKLETFRKGLKVRYSDNGQGFPEGINFKNPINLGLNLIHAQLKQLDAEFTVDTDCKFNLEFEFATTNRGSHSNF